MAGYNVKGITVEIGADATKLSEALTGIEKKYKGLDRTAAALKKSMSLKGLDTSHISGFATQQQLLGDQITRTKQKLEAYQTTLKNWDGQVASWGKNVEQAKAELGYYQSAMDDAKGRLKELGAEHTRVGQKVADAQKAFDKSNAILAEHERKVNQATTAQKESVRGVTSAREAYEREKRVLDGLNTELERLRAKYEAGGISADSYKQQLAILTTKEREQAKVVEHAKNVWDEATDRIQEMARNKDELTRQDLELTTAMKRQGKVIADAEQEYSNLSVAIEDTKDEIKGLDSKMNQAQATINLNNQKLEGQRESYLKVKAASEQMRNELYSLMNTYVTSGLAGNAFTDSLDAIANAAGKTGQALEILSQKTRLISMAAAGALVYSGIQTIDYESAWAGVTKTVEGSEQQLNSLNDSLKQLATSTASGYTEIAKYAELAGQMGVDVDNVAGFVKTVAQLSDTTNIQGEQAAQTLAQFANIMLPAEERTTDYYERLGSTIVDLGNNFATTEDDIMQMAAKLGTAGRAVGLSSQEVLALSTALSSVGIKANAGGASMSKLLSEIQLAVSTSSADLQMYADIAGMTAEEFAKAWRDDAGTAFMEFVEGIGESEDVTATLAELGITEVRMANGTRALAQSTDLYKDAMSRANVAFEANTAMAKEAEKRYNTLKTKLSQTKEVVNQTAESFGQVLVPYLSDALDWVKKTARGIGNMSDAQKDSTIKFVAMAAAISPVSKVLAKLSAGFSNAAKGISSAVKYVKGFVSLLGVAKSAGIGATEVISALFGTQLWVAGGAIAVGALAGVVTWLFKTRDAGLKAAEAMDEDREQYERLNAISERHRETAQTYSETAKQVTEQYEDQSTKVQTLTGMISDLNSKEELSRAEKELLAGAVEDLSAIYPELNLQIDENTGKLAGNTEEIEANLEKCEEAARTKALASAIESNAQAVAENTIAFQADSANLETYTEKYRKAYDTFKELNSIDRSSWTDDQQKQWEEACYNMDLYREKIVESSENIGESMDAMKQAQTDMLTSWNQLDTGAMDEIGQHLIDTLDQCSQKASEAGTKIPEQFSEQIRNGSVSASEASEYLASLVTFQSAVDSSGLFGGLIPQELIYNMMASQPDMESAIASLNQVIDWTEAINTSSHAGEEMPRAVAQALTNGQIDIQTALLNWSSVAEFESLATAAGRSGQRAVQEAALAIAGGKTDVDTACTNLGISMSTTLTQGMGNAATNAANQVVNALNGSGIPGAAGSVGKNATAMFNSSVNPQLEARAKTAVSNVARAFRSGSVPSAAGTMGSNAYNQASPYADSIYNKYSTRIGDVKSDLDDLVTYARNHPVVITTTQETVYKTSYVTERKPNGLTPMPMSLDAAVSTSFAAAEAPSVMSAETGLKARRAVSNTPIGKMLEGYGGTTSQSSSGVMGISPQSFDEQISLLSTIADRLETVANNSSKDIYMDATKVGTLTASSVRSANNRQDLIKSKLLGGA